MKGGRNHFGKSKEQKATPEAGKNGGNCNLHDGRWDQAFHPLGRNKRTVWSIPLSKFREAHFAVFPESLVEICLKATCPAGGMVLDPFSGAGTTATTAVSRGLDFIGIDCVEQYCEIARQRVRRKAEKMRGHSTV
jgi:site-specific DNA-methyltransferase (adenine-specific)